MFQRDFYGIQKKIVTLKFLLNKILKEFAKDIIYGIYKFKESFLIYFI